MNSKAKGNRGDRQKSRMRQPSWPTVVPVAEVEKSLTGALLIVGLYALQLQRSQKEGTQSFSVIPEIRERTQFEFMELMEWSRNTSDLLRTLISISQVWHSTSNERWLGAWGARYNELLEALAKASRE